MDQIKLNKIWKEHYAESELINDFAGNLMSRDSRNDGKYQWCVINLNLGYYDEESYEIVSKSTAHFIKNDAVFIVNTEPFKFVKVYPDVMSIVNVPNSLLVDFNSKLIKSRQEKIYNVFTPDLNIFSQRKILRKKLSSQFPKTNYLFTLSYIIGEFIKSDFDTSSISSLNTNLIDFHKNKNLCDIFLRRNYLIPIISMNLLNHYSLLFENKTNCKSAKTNSFLVSYAKALIDFASINNLLKYVTPPNGYCEDILGFQHGILMGAHFSNINSSVKIADNTLHAISQSLRCRNL